MRKSTNSPLLFFRKLASGRLFQTLSTSPSADTSGSVLIHCSDHVQLFPATIINQHRPIFLPKLSWTVYIAQVTSFQKNKGQIHIFKIDCRPIWIFNTFFMSSNFLNCTKCIESCSMAASIVSKNNKILFSLFILGFPSTYFSPEGFGFLALS